ncbi:hypothetical protein PAECIP111890_02711 [Paenibacillus sp. JJ-223]|nr:hypothetical protein PAECIP111890_02711 [Paenibacillus sp. JJ-223]
MSRELPCCDAPVTQVPKKVLNKFMLKDKLISKSNYVTLTSQLKTTYDP